MCVYTQREWKSFLSVLSCLKLPQTTGGKEVPSGKLSLKAALTEKSDSTKIQIFFAIVLFNWLIKF